MRQTFVMRDGCLVPKAEAPPRDSAFATPAVLSDWAPVKSVIDGKYYGGRRQYKEHLRAHGCEIVGNDWHPDRVKSAVGGFLEF